LVTLIGAGGVGKTRLLIEAMPRVSGRFPGGVELVELAGLTDPGLLLSAVASGVGVAPSSAEDVLPALVERFGDDTLVALDTFERLLPAASILAALLDACPRLHVVVTSRAALRLSGEREFVVGPLEVPPLNWRPADADAIVSVASAALFLDRARSRGLETPLAGEDIAAVVEICRRLGGWPLAIELAAARVKLLGLPTLAARLADPLSTLTGGSIDAAPRHRTISDTIAWSSDLLAPADRESFAALSTFAGGFTVEAADAILDARSAGGSLDVVGRLVDQTLLEVSLSGPEARFSMLEPVREFASSSLTPELRRSLARRHFDWFLSLAEREAGLERGADQPAWVKRITAEGDNIRQALGYARDAADAVGLLRLAGALERRFWLVIGDAALAECRSWLEAALALGSNAPHALRGRVLMRLAWAIETSPHSVVAVLRRALGEFEQAADLEGQVDALSGLGTVAAHVGEWDEAEATLKRALEVARTLGSRPDLLVELLIPLGQVESGRGNLVAARSFFEEAMRVARASGDAWGVAYGLSHLGQLEIVEDELDAAERALASGREIAREVGDIEEYVAATVFLSAAKMLTGEIDDARALIMEAAGADNRVTSRILVLDAISLWLSVSGNADAGAVCLAVADRMAHERVAMRMPWIPIRRVVEERLRPGIRPKPAPDVKTTFSLTAAIAFGLDQLSGEISTRSATQLSAREREVLAYVVKGASDAEIGTSLFISKKTVSVHVSRIKDKLHAESRIGIALAARRLGLVSRVDESSSSALLADEM
jgi:non-specific serine/threonine protein kinase